VILAQSGETPLIGANLSKLRLALRGVLRLGVHHGEQTQQNDHDANALK